LKICLPAQPPPRIASGDVPEAYDQPNCGADLGPRTLN
jgi:hypothetical protein